MKLRASEFISKAEGLKSSELSARQQLERIQSKRASLRNEIETLQYRLEALYMQLEALQSSDSDEEGGSDNSAQIAAVMAEISSTREEIYEDQQEDAELRTEEAETSAEIRAIEMEEQATLNDIEDSATRTSQNIALISSFGGDYANVSAQASNSFQQNLSQLSQAAQILGGSVATGGFSSGGNARARTSGRAAGLSQSGGSGRNFYEAANNQRKAANNVAGSFGAKGSNSPTGRNGRDLYDNQSLPDESLNSAKKNGLGKRKAGSNTNASFDALAAYMNAHNYGPDDFAVYSKDPQWRVLQRAAYPDYKMPAIDQQTARSMLNQYMTEHNYGQGDYPEYSHDPVWQELQKYAFPDFSRSLVRPNLEHASSQYTAVKKSLDNKAVKHNPIEIFGKERTSEEIVSRLSGGDMTTGSCSSLAFAYAGNRAGYDVLDYRGGASCDFFSSNNSIQMIANLPNVKSETVYGKNDLLCANELLNRMTEGKEYYLATGLHAAIVRRNEGKFEYLELQSSISKRNGWHTLNDSELKNRFGCEYAQKQEYPNFLIDVQSLSKSKEFLDVLGYINTSEGSQMKGEMGHER